MFMDWICSSDAKSARRPAAPTSRSRKQHAADHYPLQADVAYRTLVGILKRDAATDFSEPSVACGVAYRRRLQAISGLACFSHKTDLKLIHELITIVEDPNDDPRLAIAAGAALGQMADAALYAMLLVKIKNTQLSERVRLAYAAGLWRTPNVALSTQLLPLLASEDTPATIKLAAARAIGYAACAANDQALLELLDNASARPYAACAVVLGGSEAAAKKLLEVLRADLDTEPLLRELVDGSEDDTFDLLLDWMFASGQIYRRMRVAEILKDGSATREASYSYVWARLAARLSGWDGAAGMSTRAIHVELYEALTGHDAERRRLVANMLVSLHARDLLVAARDAGIEEAREALLHLDWSSRALRTSPRTHAEDYAAHAAH